MNATIVEEKSLFDRLGGVAAIDAAVESFYAKVTTDPRIARFFENVDMAKQKAFLAYAFGAPVPYSGKDLAAAHAHLVADGLNDGHFDAVAGHLQETLIELGVPEDLIGEVMTIAASTRDAVLGR